MELSQNNMNKYRCIVGDIVGATLGDKC